MQRYTIGRKLKKNSRVSTAVIPTINTENPSAHGNDSFNPFNKDMRELRRLVHQHMSLIRSKWFRPDQTDLNQQRELEKRFRKLNGELRTLEKNSPAYWGVSRVVQEMRKRLNCTGRELGIRPSLG